MIRREIEAADDYADSMHNPPEEEPDEMPEQTITAAEIANLRRKIERGSRGAWVVTYNASKEPRIESSVGVVVVPASYTMTKEDAEAIVAAHEALPRLLLALEQAERERIEAAHAREHADNEHRASLHRMLEHTEQTKADIDRAMATHGEIVAISNRQERELATARAKLDNMEPLVAEVERWIRTRHSPRLLAAWDRYREACAKS